MNAEHPDDSLGEVEIDVETQKEEKEKTVCARLVLTQEQVINITMLNEDWHEWSTLGTPHVSQSRDEELDEFPKAPVEEKEVFAKLVFTEKQEDDLREAFNSLDYLGEGKIKAADFRVVIKALGYEPTKEELQHMINAVDKGDTGKLSFENFQTAIMRKIMSLDTDGDIMKSFRLFDMDDNGLISFENVKKVTQILGTYLTDEEIEEMIDDADKDFDGFVNVQEFMRMIKNSVHIVTP